MSGGKVGSMGKCVKDGKIGVSYWVMTMDEHYDETEKLVKF